MNDRRSRKPEPMRPVGDRSGYFPPPDARVDESCFEGELWADHLGWPDDRSPILPEGPYHTGVRVDCVFLARAIDKLAEGAPAYRMTKSRAALVGIIWAMRDRNNNQPPLPAVFPDYPALIVINGADGAREMRDARWDGCTMIRDTKFAPRSVRIA